MDSKPQFIDGENALLRDENEKLKAQLKHLTNFVQLDDHLSHSINTKIQLNTTSIKAAISSLLDRNIFWDVSSQQEFLETISHSVDHISDRMFNIAVANRLRGGSLDVNRKLYELHELMSAVVEQYSVLSGKRLVFRDEVPYGSLAFVDYRYFVHAFSTLFLIIGVDLEIKLSIDAHSEHYLLEMSGISKSVFSILDSILKEEWTAEPLYHDLSAEMIFELMLVVRLLNFQGIQSNLLCTNPKGVRFTIPFGQTDLNNSSP